MRKVLKLSDNSRECRLSGRGWGVGGYDTREYAGRGLEKS